MADPEQLAILRLGVDAWNKWRNENRQRGADLSGAELNEASLRGANLREADLSRANLTGANLLGANLTGATLRGANVSRANLTKADLFGADLVGADLDGIDSHGANLNSATLMGATLVGAHFSGAALAKANLRAAKLRGADLRGAILRGADLRGANLTGADITRAHLTGADLRGAILRGADITGADLDSATLIGAHFGGTNLTEAFLRETLFIDVDLSTVKGLETCNHLGPSTIDHRTLQRSGSLPLVFLRGCGLPDRLIEYLPSLLNQAIEFYSCFISYATADQAFADRLYADLQNRGVRCWFAPHEMRGGRKVHEQIDEAIRNYDRLLLVLSESSMRSGWVKMEIARAREKERQLKRQVLFPVALVPFGSTRDWKLIDADQAEDTAREIREYFIPDFRAWKEHDAYQRAFEQLCRDLHVEPKRA